MHPACVTNEPGESAVVAALRAPGGQFLMEAGDFILVGGQGLHRRQGLLAQHPGLLDYLAGVTQHSRVLPFGFRHRPAQPGLLPPAERQRRASS